MTRRQKAIAFFVALCVLLVAAALSLNIGWIIANAGRITPIVLGIILFGLIIAGLIVYTVFLVLEIRRNEEHDSFINAVTHELKTPIASIRLYLETLQARDVSETQRREFYDIMLSDADRLQQTVEQVLKAGVLTHRRKLTQRAPVDLTTLTSECVEVARQRHHLAPEKLALAPTSAPPTSSLLVEGNADDLRTALTNLLDNAVKYSLKKIHVTVELTSPTPERVCLRVRDEGVGIPRNQLKRIFNRFYRFQAHGFKVKGTGLGLFIVKSIARQHGGRVFADSDGEGTGATFTLELPRAYLTRT